MSCSKSLRESFINKYKYSQDINVSKHLPSLFNRFTSFVIKKQQIKEDTDLVTFTLLKFWLGDGGPWAMRLYIVSEFEASSIITLPVLSQHSALSTLFLSSSFRRHNLTKVQSEADQVSGGHGALDGCCILLNKIKNAKPCLCCTVYSF